MNDLRSLKTLSLSQIREMYSNDDILRHFSISHQEERWLPNKLFCVVTGKQPGTIYAAKKTRSSKYKIMDMGGELWVSVTHYFGQAKISVPRGARRDSRVRMFPKKEKPKSFPRSKHNAFDYIDAIQKGQPLPSDGARVAVPMGTCK